MYGQTTISSTATSNAGNRIFQYEVVGLRQNDQNDKNNYPIRRSGSITINVSYDRMNEEMRRIARLGGKIVSIKPLN